MKLDFSDRFFHDAIIDEVQYEQAKFKVIYVHDVLIDVYVGDIDEYHLTRNKSEQLPNADTVLETMKQIMNDLYTKDTFERIKAILDLDDTDKDTKQRLESVHKLLITLT